MSTAWLALLTMVVVADHFRSPRRDQGAAAASVISRGELAKLEETLSTHGQTLEALRRQPASVTQSSFTEMQEKLDGRLSRIEKAIEDTAPKSDLVSVQQQMNAIEMRVAQLSKLSRRASPPSAIVVPTKSEALSPPFRIVGVELRGGERFLSVLPLGAPTLTDLHLLRPGDSQGDWHLDALEPKAAVFGVHGHSQQIPFP